MPCALDQRRSAEPRKDQAGSPGKGWNSATPATGIATWVRGCGFLPQTSPTLLSLTWNWVLILPLGVLLKGKPEQVKGDD